MFLFLFLRNEKQFLEQQYFSQNDGWFFDLYVEGNCMQGMCSTVKLLFDSEVMKLVWVYNV